MIRNSLLAVLAGLTVGAVACTDDGSGPSTGAATSLTAVSPAGGTTSVPVGTSVVISFSHAMMQGMETNAALHEGTASGAVVPGTWSWSGDRTRLTFVPDQPLKAKTQYTVHLGGGLRDAGGGGIDLTTRGQHMGGQWATSLMMGSGGMMGGNGSHMGAGWQHANGAYGMVFSFTTD